MKEWNSESWNRDVSEDPDEAGDVESLNCDEFSLSIEVAPPPLSQETLTASLEVVVIQDVGDSHQDPPTHPLFASRPITSLQVPAGPQR